MRKKTFSICLCSCLAVNAQINSLPRTSPEAVGIRSSQVMAFFDSLLALPNTDIHSVIVMRHGQVVGEMYPAPFRREYKHTQFSCSKTFVAAAVGIAIGERKLRLDDRLVTFFPKHLPPVVNWHLSSVTVEDLLTMRSGFTVDTKMRERSLQWIRSYLAKPMKAAPGKLFQYDSIDTYLLSAIVQKATGMNVLDYLKQKVFNYLNIIDVKWEMSPEGIVTGGWGLYVQAESLAKFGQLLLQRGSWHDQQLIPAKWVEAMMKRHVINKGDDYGYQMWISADDPGVVRADGAYGQYIVIMPRYDAVVAINQCTLSEGKREISYMKNILFKGALKVALPPAESYQQLLQQTYSLPLAEGEMTNAVFANYLGKGVTLSRNPLGWSALRFEADDIIEVTDTAGISARIVMGYQTWATSEVGFWPLNARYAVKNQFSTIRPPFHVGACYAWQNDELLATFHFVDWMGAVRLRFHFDGVTVNITAQENYQQRPLTIVGTVEETEESNKH